MGMGMGMGMGMEVLTKLVPREGLRAFWVVQVLWNWRTTTVLLCVGSDGASGREHEDAKCGE